MTDRDIEPLGVRLVDWMAEHRPQLDQMMSEEGSRAIVEEFMLAEGGELPDRAARIERIRGARAHAWMRHLGRAIAAVWDGAPEDAGATFERAATASGERVEALRLEEEAILERRGSGRDPLDDNRRIELVAHCRAFAEGLAGSIGLEGPPLGQEIGAWMRGHESETRAIEAEAAAAWGDRDLDASAETAPGTAAIEQEADEIRIAEAAAVFAHVRVLADGLGLVLEPETAPPAD